MIPSTGTYLTPRGPIRFRRAPDSYYYPMDDYPIKCTSINTIRHYKLISNSVDLDFLHNNFPEYYL